MKSNIHLTNDGQWCCANSEAGVFVGVWGGSFVGCFFQALLSAGFQIRRIVLV